MNSQHITKINVEVLLKGEDAKFFEMLMDINKKQGAFDSAKDFIEFVFYTGFTFVRGQFIGSMLAEQMYKHFPVIIDNLQKSITDKNTIEDFNDDVVFDKAFLDGEPAEYIIDDHNQTLKIRNRNLKNKGKWCSIYLLNKNKPLTWKGDVV